MQYSESESVKLKIKEKDINDLAESQQNNITCQHASLCYKWQLTTF